MRILVDENIPSLTVGVLVNDGHDVLDIRATPAQGLPDDYLWQIAQREQRLLITTDKGFAEHRDDTHFGVLIIRLRQPNRARIHERVMRALAQFGENEWNGRLVMMRDAVQSVWRSNADQPDDAEVS